MKDETLWKVLAIQCAMTEAKMFAMEKILIRSGACTEEGSAAQTQQILMQNLPEIAEEIHKQLVGAARAYEMDGAPFEKILERLRAHRNAWKLDLGDDK